MKNPRVTYFVILGAAAAWCASIVLAPACSAHGGAAAPAGDFLYALFRPICHQINVRSFFLFDWPFAACVRCSSIYFAFLAGTLLYPVARDVDRPLLPSRWILLCAGIPMVVDALPWGPLVYDVTTLSRSITGGIFGFVLPFFIIPVATDAARELFSTFRLQKKKGLSDA